MIENKELKTEVNEEIMNLDAAAKFLGIAKGYMYKLTSKRKIPHYKPLGKLCYFKRSDLEAFLQRNRIETADELETEAITYCVTGKAKKGGKK
jgi:excisionase family DNA binding protein